jgi:hypothetical protein
VLGLWIEPNDVTVSTALPFCYSGWPRSEERVSHHLIDGGIGWSNSELVGMLAPVRQGTSGPETVRVRHHALVISPSCECGAERTPSWPKGFIAITFINDVDRKIKITYWTQWA